MKILIKEHFIRRNIYTAFEKIVANRTEDLKIHFFYGQNWWLSGISLSKIILEGMKKYQIKSVTVTAFYLWKENLITKEKMENLCKDENSEESVNDDFETFFDYIRLGFELRDLHNTHKSTYYLPKLTFDEQELVETNDEAFLNTLRNTHDGIDADVSKVEMAASESNSKFVRGWCARHTYMITNPYIYLVKDSYCCC